jgi:hypothetical protein
VCDSAVRAEYCLSVVQQQNVFTQRGPRPLFNPLEIPGQIYVLVLVQKGGYPRGADTAIAPVGPDNPTAAMWWKGLGEWACDGFVECVGLG